MLGNTVEWPRWDQRLTAPEVSRAQCTLLNWLMIDYRGTSDNQGFSCSWCRHVNYPLWPGQMTPNYMHWQFLVIHLTFWRHLGHSIQSPLQILFISNTFGLNWIMKNEAWRPSELCVLWHDIFPKCDQIGEASIDSENNKQIRKCTTKCFLTTMFQLIFCFPPQEKKNVGPGQNTNRRASQSPRFALLSPRSEY